MAEDSDLEKTEPATEKRLSKAREDGDIPRSRELATCSVLFTAGLCILAIGDSLALALKKSLSTGLSFERSIAFDPMLLLLKISDSIYSLITAFVPLAFVLILVAIAAPVLIGGWVFSGSAFMPKFSKLNPLKGLGNMFSKNSLVELTKSIVKAILVSSVAYVVIKSDIEPILALSSIPIENSINQVADLLLSGFLWIASVLVVIAAIDVPFQLYNYAEKMKMTKEEVKQEGKEAEGNPEIKAKIRQQQREMSRRRMMSAIPTADVVITNPTHYAVAIKYKGEGMRAPLVVAKGTDAVAMKIREIAAENNILTMEAPKLARALYAHTELDKEIPEALYSAVAEVLAYVFQMRVFKNEGGYQPEAPQVLVVPEAMDPHSLLPITGVDNSGAFA
jgi:flagellar biosynthetic protein FlhB